MSNRWEDLQENDFRCFGFLKVDVVGHSALSRKEPSGQVEKTLDAFEKYVETKVKRRNGQIWMWQGDGGLCAFYCDRDLLARSAVCSAIEILQNLDSFNRDHCLLSKGLSIRLAVHLGTAKFREAKGGIHSEAINFVAHLEERSSPNRISISEEVYKELVHALRAEFCVTGKFEEKQVYMNRIPTKGLLPTEIM